MFEQHPDKIFITCVGESAQDENGDFVKPPVNSVSEHKGRYQVNKNSSFIIGNDGNRIEYSGIFFSPYDIMNISLGAKVKIVKKDGAVIDGSVQQFHRSQINTRIWL